MCQDWTGRKNLCNSSSMVVLKKTKHHYKLNASSVPSLEALSVCFPGLRI